MYFFGKYHQENYGRIPLEIQDSRFKDIDNKSQDKKQNKTKK